MSSCVLVGLTPQPLGLRCGACGLLVPCVGLPPPLQPLGAPAKASQAAAMLPGGCVHTCVLCTASLRSPPCVPLPACAPTRLSAPQLCMPANSITCNLRAGAGLENFGHAVACRPLLQRRLHQQGAVSVWRCEGNDVGRPELGLSVCPSAEFPQDSVCFHRVEEPVVHPLQARRGRWWGRRLDPRAWAACVSWSTQLGRIGGSSCGDFAACVC